MKHKSNLTTCEVTAKKRGLLLLFAAAFPQFLKRVLTARENNLSQHIRGGWHGCNGRDESPPIPKRSASTPSRVLAETGVISLYRMKTDYYLLQLALTVDQRLSYRPRVISRIILLKTIPNCLRIIIKIEILY
jgi:hypothetical protein